MSYLTYDKVKIFLSNADVVAPVGSQDYIPVYATTFSSNNAVPTTRLRRIGSTIDYYNQTGPKSLSFSASVVPTFVIGGYNQLFDFYLPLVTGDFSFGSHLKVPDMVFERVYLTSLSFEVVPWRVLSLNLRLDAIGAVAGTVLTQAPSELAGTEDVTDYLRGVTDGGYLTGKNYQSLNFSFEAERLPEFNLGAPHAVGARLSALRKRVSINGCDDLSTLVDFSPDGASATVSVDLLQGSKYEPSPPPSEGQIVISGKIVSRDISVNSSGVISGSLEVLEESI